MVYRAVTICSSYELMHKEFDFIEKISVKNGYPINFIKCQIRNTLNRHFEQNGNKTEDIPGRKHESKDTMKKEQIFVDLSFVGKPTELLGKKIIKLAIEIRLQIHIQPIPRPPPAINKCFPTKDSIPKELQSNIINQVGCKNCPASYMDKTIRQAIRRFSNL
ncbi:unnamed protein product [Didymodactylos carnosus]|uniref:Helix-turn-helix domain-containing protein n=1 Tax=Didymodactylos carnosus TaxID=1234261 RepID=A0A815YZX9_9BILA|nr:unnamed protein product [Didymodactylos carnosus]CAF1577463.1 unnamed protein product [Didymodactylos carnosus]CAF4283582.1 unnamed protein product [Didymodactylos carnosus]CAF4443374.1 unnamed protein product [Didymodactylos carnosus]